MPQKNICINKFDAQRINSLTKIIKKKIDKSPQKNISFAEYMRLALYHKKFGYYTTGKTPIGTNGDFITAPELGDIFAKCLAKQCRELFHNSILSNQREYNILELGPGTGKLAYDLIKELKKDNRPINYNLLEISPSLTIKQKEKLSVFNNDNKITINHLTKLDPDHRLSGIIIANEVLDALPVNCFITSNEQINKIYELNIIFDENKNKFDFIKYYPNKNFTRNLLDHLLKLNLPNNYKSEINLGLDNFISNLSNFINSGFMIFIDYGFLEHEYYHHDRNTGTIMCHYLHFCHSDPFWYPGLQDITSHVNFSYLINISKKYNLELFSFQNLASFLLDFDLIELAQENHCPKICAEINTLSSPAEMGELFKVTILVK